MSSPNASDLHQVSDRLAKNAMRHFSERLIEMVLFAAATVSVLTTVGIVYVLVSESINFFQQRQHCRFSDRQPMDAAIR
jgi:phosphate transport system permease protein